MALSQKLTPAQFKVARHLSRAKRFGGEFSALAKVASNSPRGGAQVVHKMAEQNLLTRDGSDMFLTFKGMRSYREECERRDADSGCMAFQMNAEEARAAESLMTWNVQEMKGRMREQRNVWENRRSPLVREVHELQRRTEAGQKRRDALAEWVAVVERAGGDAAALKAQVATIDETLLPDLERLSALNVEWSKLKEVCKWAEYADDGLHWLIFAQSELDKHDKVGVWAPDYHLTREREA